jgi:hypothetical protein
MATVGSSEFQTSMKAGFQCPSPPTDTFMTVTVRYSDGRQLEQDVKGCLAFGSVGKVFQVLRRY